MDPKTSFRQCGMECKLPSKEKKTSIKIRRCFTFSQGESESSLPCSGKREQISWYIWMLLVFY